MRRILVVAGLAASLCVGLASASFAKTKHPAPPPPPPPAWSWAGFYVGGNIGYGFGSSNTSVAFFDPTGTLITPQNSFAMDGVLGGAQLGYNWQLDNWVLGLETDFQGTTQSGNGNYLCPVTACSAGPFVANISQQLQWFGTARGRVGWVAMPDSLFYITGGLAYGDIRSSETITGGSPPQPPASFGFNTVRAGWTIGTGYEGHIVGNWTWKIEYLFVDLGDIGGTALTSIVSSGVGYCDTHVCHLGTSFNSTFTDNIVRVGFNYKWP